MPLYLLPSPQIISRRLAESRMLEVRRDGERSDGRPRADGTLERRGGVPITLSSDGRGHRSLVATGLSPAAEKGATGRIRGLSYKFANFEDMHLS